MTYRHTVLGRGIRKTIRIVSNVSLSTACAVLVLLFMFGLMMSGMVSLAVYSGVIMGLALVTLGVVVIFSLKIVKAQQEQFNGLNSLSDIRKSIDRLERSSVGLHESFRETTKKLLVESARTVCAEIEALHSIDKKINLKHPLPSMSGWAATPGLVNLIIDTMRDGDVQTVVDLGSGVSTIAAGYAAQEGGAGKVVSLDHDKHYVSTTRHAIAMHGLSKFIDLRHAPLKEQIIDGEKYIWYSQEKLEGLVKIDLLIVDGPPHATQSLARFPALPVLHSRLSKKAMIIVDDYAREDERKMVDLWIEMYPEFTKIEIMGLKGIAVLTRQ